MELHDFGWAVQELKRGIKVKRAAWKFTGSFCWLKSPVDLDAEWCRDPVLRRLAEGSGGSVAGSYTLYKYVYEEDNTPYIQSFLPSLEDILATDWTEARFCYIDDLEEAYVGSKQ